MSTVHSKTMRKAKKTPKTVIGGTQHKAATSFRAKKLNAYEKTRNYRDQGVVWVSPTRGKVYTNVVVSWLMLQWPMNQFRSQLIATEGMEVGAAYNYLVETTMDRKLLRKSVGTEYGDALADAPFVLTTEEDNVLPPDAAVKLLAAIFTCPDCGGEVGGAQWKCKKGHKGYDAVSGLYFVKTDPPIPMAFGTPNRSKKNLDFKPRSVAEAVKKGAVIEVNGIAMGCSLFRKALFAKLPKPWFKTTPNATQDLYFCGNAKRKGARFGVHCGLRIGHYQAGTRTLY